ncbi:protein WVD2-like 7 isoform X1 [Quillaja saponaria]|uniref:Protein WVD2-like 7 isoform X1 n=1 Tax=Quillaja saponaria TaxID=32244 RepID=A0AAD7KP12_QUISA|nr:protein WVD2-like 7 isoform X1 [Quillaja saponaria]KAJ7943012.1 protein WVD2-like 7 isoform X1 [Quillaja saponaria]
MEHIPKLVKVMCQTELVTKKILNKMETAIMFQFDKSPEGSDYHEQCETRECKTEKAFIEDPGITFSNLQMESTLNNSGILEDKFINNVGSKELHQAESITRYILSVNDEADVEVKKYLNNIKNNDQSVESIDPTLDTETAGDVKKTNSELSSVPSPKLTDASGTKPSKTEVQSQNAIFSSSHMNPAKNPNRRERESPRFMNMEKNLLRTAIPSTESVCRTPKLKDFGTQKKLNFETKSTSVEKISGVRKSVASQPSIQKGVQAADRLNRIINSRKSDARAVSVAFNFKCNERAARRKEFHKKLEEKMHAKEAEINQIQAMSQEKTQAQIKCFRKSLNFKATPMPSFYHAPVSSSDGNKVNLCSCYLSFPS